MDKVAVYAGTRNLYEQMFVCLKSLLANTRMDRVYLLIEDDEFPYSLPDVCRIMNVSEQQFFPSGSPNFTSPRTGRSAPGIRTWSLIRPVSFLQKNSVRR